MAGILTNNYDTSKTFLWNARSSRGTYTNSTGSPVTLVAGRVMGRITTSRLLVGQVAAATDGSQQPIGVLGDTYGPIADGASVIITIFDSGDVAQEKLVFNASETLNTVITSDTTIAQALTRNTGLKLIACTDLTDYDNATP